MLQYRAAMGRAELAVPKAKPQTVPPLAHTFFVHSCAAARQKLRRSVLIKAVTALFATLSYSLRASRSSAFFSTSAEVRVCYSFRESGENEDVIHFINTILVMV